MTRFFEAPAPGLEQAYEGTLVHAEQSAFQRIEVYDHASFGRMLVLDGLVQTTLADEFCYHEMLVHVPLLAHPAPKRVLIVGGGDGGTLRRVLEHGVEEAVMVEIDDRVTAVCRDTMPEIAASAFDDPRSTVLFADGNAYVRDGGEPFDAIIIDSSDPVGPGVVLFSPDFYGACRARLRPGGVLSAQIGTPLYAPSEARMAVTNASRAFNDVRAYLGGVPTYPGTLWLYMLAGEGLEVSGAAAGERARARGIEARYWTPQLHEAAFALPGFVRGVLAGGRSLIEAR